MAPAAAYAKRILGHLEQMAMAGTAAHLSQSSLGDPPLKGQ